MLSSNIQAIDNEKLKVSKFDEFVTHMNELPPALLSAVSSEVGAAIKEIKAHYVETAKKKLSEEGLKADSYDIFDQQGAGNVRMVKGDSVEVSGHRQLQGQKHKEL